MEPNKQQIQSLQSIIERIDGGVVALSILLNEIDPDDKLPVTAVYYRFIKEFRELGISISNLAD